MSPSVEHARLGDLFHALLDASQEQREHELSTLEPALAARLRALLSADQDTRDPLASAVRDGAAALLHSVPEGMRLGSWRVLRELGAGGMGTVLLAERADGQFEQQVAIKLIRGFPTQDGQRRLRQERQILAQLDHPNIARLIDGGQTDDGQPYVVMEYVQGLGLLEHIAAARLDLSARLILFDRIADAVQHAHGRLVIHRDLKPGNVLVLPGGEPKLLDFGVAKLVDVGADSARHTSTRVFTQGYASPEQRAGQNVSTATDVYALGVVLREMLSGERGSAQPAELPEGFMALPLPADLRGILARATEAEPAHRYPTVEALRADLARWREGRPVLAAPDHWFYRTGKFIRRHRLGVAMLVLALLASSTFVWRLAVERSRALAAEKQTARALAVAERETQAARASLDFLSRTLAAASPDVAMSTQISVRDLLDQARAGIEADASLPTPARRSVQRLLGTLYMSLGEPAIAATLLAAGSQDVIPESRSEALAFAIELDNLSSVLATLERHDQAMPPARKAAELRERFAPDDAAARFASAAQSAFVHYRRNELDQAHAQWDALLANANATSNTPAEAVLEVFTLAASTWLAQGEPGRALVLSQRGIAFAQARKVPPESSSRINLMRVHAELLADSGRAGDAVALLRDALATQERTAGLSGIRAGNLFNALGNALNMQGRYREAVAAHEKAHAAYARAMHSDVEEAISLSNLAAVMENAGDYEGALRHIDSAIEIFTHSGNAIGQAPGNALRNRARTLGLAGRHAEALAQLTALRETARHDEGEDSVNYALAVWQLAVLARHMNDSEHGPALLEEAVARLTAILGPDHILFAHAHRLRASFALLRGELATASEEIDMAIAQLGAPGGVDVDLAIARAERAGISLAQGRTNAARKQLAQALPVLREAMLPTEVNRAYAERLAVRLGLDAARD